MIENKEIQIEILMERMKHLKVFRAKEISKSLYPEEFRSQKEAADEIVQI